MNNNSLKNQMNSRVIQSANTQEISKHEKKSIFHRKRTSNFEERKQSRIFDNGFSDKVFDVAYENVLDLKFNSTFINSQRSFRKSEIDEAFEKQTNVDEENILSLRINETIISKNSGSVKRMKGNLKLEGNENNKTNKNLSEISNDTPRISFALPSDIPNISFAVENFGNGNKYKYKIISPLEQENVGEEKNKYLEKRMKLYFFIISGYNEGFNFWEAIMFIKKALLIGISPLVNYLDKRSVAILIIFMLLIYYFVNALWKIYIGAQIRRFESLSIIIAISTVSLGLFASFEDIPMISRAITLLIIIFINILFIIYFLAKIMILKVSTIQRSINKAKTMMKKKSSSSIRKKLF
jgi:hypothetical protein